MTYIHRYVHGALVTAVWLGGVVGTSQADDWPQWRGPHRDGVWHETGLMTQLPSGQLPLLWRTPIGSGYSGPTVAQGQVYVMDRLTEPQPQERIHCLDAKTGHIRWTHAYDCVYENVDYIAGPRASVTIDDQQCYALGTMGNLHCLSTAGKLLWRKDLRAEYNVRMPIWGIAASPIVSGNLVIVQIAGTPGACVVALDKMTGKEVWRALDDQGSYSSPILIEHAGQTQLIVWTGDHVAALQPQTGQVFWKYPFPPTRMVIGIATPVFDRGRILVSSFYDGSLLLQLGQEAHDVELIWKRCGKDEQNTDSLHSIISTPILDGDHIYGVDSYGELRCLDAKHGDRLWLDQTAVPKIRWGTIHFVRNGSRYWLFNDRGELIVATLEPTGFHETSRAQLIAPTKGQLNRRDGVCWSHPAFADKHIFARNDQEIVCASLAAEALPSVSP